MIKKQLPHPRQLIGEIRFTLERKSAPIKMEMSSTRAPANAGSEPLNPASDRSGCRGRIRMSFLGVWVRLEGGGGWRRSVLKRSGGLNCCFSFLFV